MNVYNFSLSDFEKYFLSIDEKRGRALTLYKWLYEIGISDFDEITDFKDELREKLKSDFEIATIKLVDKKEGIDVGKYLFELSDGGRIETVLMQHDYGNSICVSTQLGCNMGCTFCESGLHKKVRNLEISEMVQQIICTQREAKIKADAVVVMGIGEPFDNYDNTIKFIDIISAPKGLAIGPRHITVSTCGIVPKIVEFMNKQTPNNLAVSLHAPNNEIRNQLMPINKKYDINELVETVKKYSFMSHKKVTFEYIMLKGVNDSLECAKQLADLLDGINCYVNLIPYNETSNLQYEKTDKQHMINFLKVIKKKGRVITIRREFGSDLKAACGQLRSEYEKSE